MNHLFNALGMLKMVSVVTCVPGTALPALPTGPSVLFFGAGEVTARAVSPVDPQPVISSSCPHRDGTDRAGRNLAAVT